MNAIIISFICYLILIIIVGFYSSKLTKNINDYALGGQRLGPTIIAFSERASGESAWLILGLPGAALTLGLLELWTVLGCLGGIFLSWIIIAFPIRQATEEYNINTLPEYFERKLDDKTGIIRLLSSLIITFFFIFYIAAQFRGAGKVLNATFGMTEIEGMFLGASIILIYTIMGGFLAVAWTDLIQGIIMIGALIILPLVGWIELLNNNHKIILDSTTLFGSNKGIAAFTTTIGGLSWGLGYMGQPHLIARYMAINKKENIKISRTIAFTWAIPAFFGAMFIGLVGASLIKNGLLSFEGNIIASISDFPDPEKLMPIMASYLLPEWLAGIIICGAIAAMMSTADSQLLISTTVLTEDIAQKYFKKNTNKKNLLRTGRVLTVVIGIIAFFMAWQSQHLVFEMVSYAWGGLGSSFGPALALSLWWKGVRKEGIFIGIICGTLFTIFPIFSEIITPRFSAFFISTFSIILISMIKKSNKN